MQRPQRPSHGRLAIVSRGLIRPSANLYLVFGHLPTARPFIAIVLFLADEEARFTVDTEHFAQSCSFLLRRTLTFRTVDTPSVASGEASDGSG